MNVARHAWAVMLGLACGLGAGAQVFQAETVAGSDWAGDGGLANLARLLQLQGVAVSSSGDIYVADAADHRVRKISPTGIISACAGNGHPGFQGDGGAAASSQLRNPYGIALDTAGYLYIADLGNARIRRVSPDGTIDTFAGGGTKDPAQNEGSPATSVALSAPRNIALDGAGNVYFSDFGGNRVYRVDSGGALTIVAGSGKAGFSGDWAAARTAQLASPAGLAIDRSGSLYIADSGNRRIRKVDHTVITTVVDGGRPGATPSTPITTPIGLAFDPDGTLWVTDPGGNQMMRISATLTYSPLAQPAQDVAIDGQGNVVVVTGNQVVKRPLSGIVSGFSGLPDSAYLGDGRSVTQSRLLDPRGVAVGLDGSIYIADTGHHRVRRVSPGGIIETVAGTGQQGYSGDGGRALLAKLDTPVGLAMDAAGVLYIADSGNQRIRIVDPSGYISTAVGSGVRSRSVDGTLGPYAQLDTPEWLAMGADGALYFTQAGTHMVSKLVDGAVHTVAGTGTRGFGWDGVQATLAPLDTPRGVAVDAMGTVYISEKGNKRVRKVMAPAPGAAPVLTTVTGQLDSPGPLAVDAQGNLFVTDATTATLTLIGSGGVPRAVAGVGWEVFTGDTGPALSTGLIGPSGLAFDASGRILVADSGNARVRRLAAVAVAPGAITAASAMVVNAASQQAGPVSPGEIVTLYTDAVRAGDSNVEVRANGASTTVFYAGAGQINLLIPDSCAGVDACQLEVRVNGESRVTAQAATAALSPAIFAGPAGTGQAAALNEDGSYNSESNPAVRGAAIVLYATGAGLAATRPPITVQIGNYMADVLWSGDAPGYPGLVQVNVRVPGGFAPPGVLPVTLFAGNATSQRGVTIAVR